MASYPKIWTSTLNDQWFVGLSLSERGVWFQLILLAKQNGDSSIVSARSWTGFGTMLGCDGKTARKILGKFHQDGKITCEVLINKVIQVTVLKYLEYQKVSTGKQVRENSLKQGKVRENSPINKDKDEIKGNKINIIPFREIVDHLNSCLGSNYSYKSKKTQLLITARWNEDFRVEDFKYVHAVKMEEWMDSDMAKFMRPETLYSNKFEGYRQQKPKNPNSNLPEWQKNNRELMKKNLENL